MPDMIEYASFGFAVLVWWTWPVLWAVVMTAVYASYRVSSWRDRKREEALGRDVVPCLRHMGTTADGVEHWCWQQDGHAGPHHNQYGVPQDDFDVEHQEAWENESPTDEELVIPVSPRLCTWGEDGSGNESACWKPHGHDGPHMVQDHFTGDLFER